MERPRQRLRDVIEDYMHVDISDFIIESAQNQAIVDAWESIAAPVEHKSAKGDESDVVVDTANRFDKTHKEFDYCAKEQVLDPEQIVQHMVASTADVTNVVQIPSTAVRILLNHFNWDVVTLMERFYGDDQDKLFSEAGVVNPFKTSDDATTNELAEECGICFDTLPLTKSACDHRFCEECWRRYFTGKIMEEGVGQTIACASSGCDIFVDDATVMRLLANDPDVKLKYQLLITNTFVACNRLLRWCPSANCSNAIRVRHLDSIQRVTCQCSHVFCFDCGEDWHDPIKCGMLKDWLKRCNEDTGTSVWVTANTKGCPKCDAAIEKNGGCSHMKCTNSSCNTEFCWICMSLWHEHDQEIMCNTYDRMIVPGKGTQSALHKYLFYCDRYINHMNSIKLEHKLYEMVERKMDVMQQPPLAKTWIDVQFLKLAVDDLVQCRQTLMYTYAFAFYLQKNSQTEIFAANQKDLESAIETLSEYLEWDLKEATNYDEIKQKIQDKCSYCKSRKKVLLEHVHEGYDNNSWKYTLSFN